MAYFYHTSPTHMSDFASISTYGIQDSLNKVNQYKVGKLIAFLCRCIIKWVGDYMIWLESGSGMVCAWSGTEAMWFHCVWVPGGADWRH